MTGPGQAAHAEAARRYLAQQRWFGGKGRGFAVTHRRALPWLSDPGAWPAVRIELVTVTFDDGGAEVYQLPLAYYATAQEHLAHAELGRWAEDDVGPAWGYDALHDKRATGYLLHGILRERRVDGLSFHRLDGADHAIDAPSLLMPGEQSNSSLAFGEEALLKVFRRVAPGRNPDVEIHELLTRDGVDKIAPLLGWIETEWSGPAPGAPDAAATADLAMLQQFLRTATDGWALALASVRDLFAEADLHADEVGGDFAGEAHRLGAATAEIHRHLAAVLPTGSWGRRELCAAGAAMQQRLDRAVEAVPDLAPFVAGLRTAYDDLAVLGWPVPVQRVHGDLHLGQTLRTVLGWKIIDFEGEPAKPLADRVAPDVVLRDVAGMLRSFDYAAATLLPDYPHHAQIAYRAREWAQRNRGAFCDGYAAEVGDDPREQAVLMRAYETDKAVYEVVYEARNRPTWLPIPLAAVARLADAEQAGEAS